jgi:hypothetical protein
VGLIRQMALKVLSPINFHALPMGERLAQVDSDVLDRHPPVFILGPPRVGSTVLMQMLSQQLNVIYLRNYHQWVFGFPRLGELIFRGQQTPNLALESQHGSTGGLNGAWEGGEWWYRFFPRAPNYVDEATARLVDERALLRSVTNWTSGTQRSLMFKNTYASLRIRTLARVFPNARYIHVSRGLLGNAHSILEARHAALGSYARWFGLRPPGWEQAALGDPISQVLFQIRQTHETIAEDLESFGVPTRFVHKVQYEDLCASPEKTIRGLEVFASGFGIRGRIPPSLPGQLPRRENFRIDSELNRQLVDRLKLEGWSG